MLIDLVERIIRQKPGLTASEIASALYGPNGYHQRVAAECRMLVYIGRIERRGSGGPREPYTYHPSSDEAAASRSRHARR
jgi:hypothetical protein